MKELSFYEYLKMYYETGKCHKLVILITKSQIVYELGGNNHLDMALNLCKRMFPNRNYNEENIYENAIFLCSIGYDLAVDIPKEISYEQYVCLKKIISDVDRFREDFGLDTECYFDEDSLLESSKKRIKDNLELEKDEVIIGIPLKKEKENVL